VSEEGVDEAVDEEKKEAMQGAASLRAPRIAPRQGSEAETERAKKVEEDGCKEYADSRKQCKNAGLARKHNGRTYLSRLAQPGRQVMHVLVGRIVGESDHARGELLDQRLARAAHQRLAGRAHRVLGPVAVVVLLRRREDIRMREGEKKRRIEG
jgi:hypothetical protein